MNKKRYIVLACAIVIAIVCITMFSVHNPNRAVLEPIEIPASKPHQHISPDEQIVEHTHRYGQLTEHSVGVPETETPAPDYMKMSRIQRAWAQLDLAEIRAKWQPYTIVEMHEKWFWKAMIRGMGPDFSYEEEWGQFEKEHPDKRPDQWIQRYLDLGYPFHYHYHYRQALSHRGTIERNRKRADLSPEDRRRVFRGVGLPPEATWEEYEDTYIKHEVLARLAFDKQLRDDPSAAGGVYWVDSGVIPFKSDTVYVYISDDSPISNIIGPNLTQKQETDLKMFGIAPKGMKVVYMDKSGIPLPSDMKPRFYERMMVQLEQAEQMVYQQIADHDSLFSETGKGDAQKPVPIEHSDAPHEHEHSHKHVSPTDTTDEQITQQIVPPRVVGDRLPPRPPGPPGSDQIMKWFEELILLHGGDLPKDLKKLQEITEELKAIRREGEKKIHPKPTRSTSPEKSSEQ